MHSFAAFVGLAVIVTLTPGPATALVLRSTLRGGRRAALETTAGNSIGVLFWGAASAAGIAALVAASEVAFLVLKVSGAIVLVLLGIQAWRTRSQLPPGGRASGNAFRDGVVTALANPKLAVFFVALFPQFLSGGRSTLLTGLAMAALIVALDLVWFSTLALAVTRARRAFGEGRWSQRLERLSGSVMIALGLSLALESR